LNVLDFIQGMGTFNLLRTWAGQRQALSQYNLLHALYQCIYMTKL